MRESYWFKLFGIYWVESTCGKIRIIMFQKPTIMFGSSTLENVEKF